MQGRDITQTSTAYEYLLEKSRVKYELVLG
jgi:hypothetical protein